jgi:hypothetical protein
MKSNIKAIKMSFNQEIKRSTMPESYNELVNNIMLAFIIGEKEADCLNIFYLDDEGDKVSISNDFDFNQVLIYLERQSISTLKILIEMEKKDFVIVNPDFASEKSITLSKSINLEKEKSVKNFGEWEHELVNVNSNEMKEDNNETLFRIVNETNHKEKESISKKDIPESLKEPINVEKLKAKVFNYVTKKVANKIDRVKDKLIGEITEKCFAYIEKKNRKISSTVHENVRCDGCNSFPIIGDRYKCTICNNFDFCQTCESKFYVEHNHPFLKIRNPESAPSKIITILRDDEANTKDDFFSFKKVNNTINQYINKAVENIESIASIENINQLFGAKDRKKLSSTGTKRTYIETTNNRTNLRKTFKLINNGSEAWPKPCFFTCLSEQVFIQVCSVPIRVRVEPGKETNVEIVFDLGNVPCQGEYETVWRLQDEKREFFGEEFRFTICVNFTNDIQIKSEFGEKPKDIIKKQVTLKELIQTKYSREGVFERLRKEIPDVTDSEINNAIIRVGPNYDLCFRMLSNKNHTCGIYQAKHYN